MSEPALSEVRVAIVREGDVVLARQAGRQLAVRLGFSESDPMFVATAISELARNMIVHAGTGEVLLRVVRKNGRDGIEVIATDRGPGIADIDQAMKEGFSTVNSLGLGLPGARRLMDEFEITSTVGTGTTIVMRKWTKLSASRLRGHLTLG
jgi:serine/threonine-protein kinase RsbT